MLHAASVSLSIHPQVGQGFIRSKRLARGPKQEERGTARIRRGSQTRANQQNGSRRRPSERRRPTQQLTKSGFTLHTGAIGEETQLFSVFPCSSAGERDSPAVAAQDRNARVN